jgi:integrase
VVGEVKTARSRRTIHLPAPVVDALRAHQARQAKERLAAGPGKWVDHGLVFTTQLGTPYDPDNFARHFVAMARKAGLGHWHPHEARHSAASLMLAQGVPLHVVSEVLGHSSIRLTKDVYGHLEASTRQGATEATAAALLGP